MIRNLDENKTVLYFTQEINYSLKTVLLIFYVLLIKKSIKQRC